MKIALLRVNDAYACRIQIFNENINIRSELFKPKWDSNFKIVWTNFPDNSETAWYGGTVILDLSVLLAVSLSLWLKFWKRRLTKRHQLRIVKLKKQNKNKNKFTKFKFAWDCRCSIHLYVITLVAAVTFFMWLLVAVVTMITVLLWLQLTLYAVMIICNGNI